MLKQGPRQALAVAPLLGPGPAGWQGVAVRRGWPADLGQDSGGVPIEGRLDRRAATICSKARSPPVAWESGPGPAGPGQCGAGRSPSEQPARPQCGPIPDAR